MVVVFYWLFGVLLVVLLLFCGSDKLVVMAARQIWFQHLRVCGCVLWLAMVCNLGVSALRYVHYSSIGTDRYNSIQRLLEAERDAVLSAAMCALLVAVNRICGGAQAYSRLRNNFQAMEAQARSASAAAMKEKTN